MQLEEDDFAQFSRLHGSLLRFVNEAAGVIPGNPDARGIFAQDLNAKLRLYDVLYNDPRSHIDSYLDANPDRLDEEELQIIESWKSLRRGKFLVYRQLKKHAILLPVTESAIAYGVLGPTEPIADVVGKPLPAMVETALFPFRGMITYDGLMLRDSIRFGKGLRETMNENYKAAQAGSGIVTCLSPLGIPKKKKTATDHAQSFARRLRDRLLSLREKRNLLEKFENDVVPAFNTWVEKHHGDLRDRCDELQSEVDHLAEIVERAETLMMFGGEESGARAVAAATEDIEEEKALHDAFAESANRGPNETEDPGKNDTDSFGGGPFGGNPFDDIPDFLLDSMIGDFLREMRGVDPSRLSKADFAKAKREFIATFEHIAAGDQAGFEKAMLKIGADDSEANQNAVKKLFRKLARQVHPDRNPDFNEEAREIWEELQLRKDALDLPSLELLETKWRLIREDAFNSRDRKQLDRFRVRLDEQELQIEDAFADYTTHPMWGCKEKTPPAKTRRQVKRDLEDIIATLEMEAEDLHQQLKEITEIKSFGSVSATKRPRKKTPKRKQKSKSKSRNKGKSRNKTVAKKAPQKKSPKKSAGKTAPPKTESKPEEQYQQACFDFE